MRGPSAACALVALLPALAGCIDALGSGGSATSDDIGGANFHVRQTDFYHSYRANDETWTDSFSWSCPEGKANLEVRHSLSAGVEKVVVKDANGATLLTQEFSRGTREGEFSMGTGAPGVWTIVLEKREARGAFDVHLWRDVDVPARG